MTFLTDVARALRAAPPYRLLETLRAELNERFSADHVDLLLADYGLRVLHSVADPDTEEGHPLETSAAGRALASQDPLTTTRGGDGQVDLYLPVTVRGDRLGVLALRLPEHLLTSETVAELEEFAEVLGHELVVAERDTDLFRRARRSSRLTLAAEIQWDLLPGRAFTCPSYSLGAHLEPAYAIRGDNFDWSAGPDELVLTVTNGMGEGSRAALLTSLVVNALRNARRAGVGLADQAALADQALYGEYRGESHVSTLLLRFEPATGRCEVIDAGSPRLLLLREGTVEAIPFEAQLPLGMFEETTYVTQELQVLPGDRLVLVSDGVYDSLRAGERYGLRALGRAIHASRLLPAASVPRAILAELSAFRDSEQEDDALVVCLDWHGPDREITG
ncbi:serine/threonine-protein phosphatase [Streptomyces durbertensis]|uniref:Serine/threonine-protein phosphatase n=1 Tax=Streptomyces durbertensis TaxID=2448886 RepID=A0ABR6EPF7_9ACTN|nr:PP2C family protein-serine/threonine phosphatase [Streptomyces durbertensis]MBB1246795.1 serine/threonine-protein phosphatase [Streptomyces durbertensis]